MSRHAILVLHFTPDRIRSDPGTVIADIAASLRAGRDRPPLPIQARPAA